MELYKFDGFSSTVKEWNALRKAAVEMAFKEMLFPQLRYFLIIWSLGDIRDATTRLVRLASLFDV